MDISKAKGAIELVAQKQGVPVEAVIREIELAMEEAMQNPDPLVQLRWKSIPCLGEKPTALEFIAYMRGKVHSN